MRMRLTLVATMALGIAMVIPATALALDAAPTPNAATAVVPVKRLNPDGSIPKQWNLPKPPRVSHPDVPPPSAGGSGDGSNSMSFTGFEDGDMIVVLGTLTGHCGEWDAPRYTGIYSSCVWSANTEPRNGVQRETPNKYKGYDEAYAMWVPSVSVAKRIAARDYCRAQNGEPYVLSPYKKSESSWYCSKLLWGSYYHTSKIDLDADGGAYVWPADILNDSQTSTFRHAS